MHRSQLSSEITHSARKKKKEKKNFIPIRESKKQFTLTFSDDWVFEKKEDTLHQRCGFPMRFPPPPPPFSLTRARRREISDSFTRNEITRALYIARSKTEGGWGEEEERR